MVFLTAFAAPAARAEAARSPRDAALQICPQLASFSSRHFDLLIDEDPLVASAQLGVLEDTWDVFFHETTRIGLKPVPPQHRLLCILFPTQQNFRDYLRLIGEEDADWSVGAFIASTGQTAFYHDRDNPVFAECRRQCAQLREDQHRLEERLGATPASDITARVQFQQQLRQLSIVRADLVRRLQAAAARTTLGKVRHETAHQLLCASGLQRPAAPYPWFLDEGLACLFETVDASGHGAPDQPSEFRLFSLRRAAADGTLISTARLLEYEPKPGDDASLVAVRYAQAWQLVHYLWQTRPDALRDLMRDLSDSSAPATWPAFFRRHLGNLPDTLPIPPKASP